MTDHEHDQKQEGLDEADLDAEVEELPDRTAMSIVNPNPGEPPMA